MDKIVLGAQELETLIALTTKEQERGLMFNTSFVVMSFPFANAGIKKFWMKNTPQALDIVFCSKGKIEKICQGEPYSLQYLGPNFPVDLVVELPKGSVEKLGIVVGQTAKLKFSLQTLAKKYQIG